MLGAVAGAKVQLARGRALRGALAFAAFLMLTSVAVGGRSTARRRRNPIQ